MMFLFSGSPGVGHEESLVGPRFVPVQQDGPKDLQLGDEWVSWGLAMDTNVAEKGVTVGRNTGCTEKPHTSSIFPVSVF